MEYSIFRITLDIHRHQSQVSIPVMYGDTAVRLLVTLSDGGMPYIIGKSCWAQFIATKPDKPKPLLRECIIENGTTIRLDFDNGIADVAGVYDCEIRLYGAEGKLTSPCFTMVVDPRIVADYEGDEAEKGFIDQIGATMAEFRENEGKRASAEELRDTAEQERKTAEEARKEAEQERANAEKERATAEKKREGRIKNLEYKYLFTRDASTDGIGDGYVEIEVPANCVIEVTVDSHVEGPEFYNDYFKLYCDNSEHDNHKVLENASNQKVYTIDSSNTSPCYWYIPYSLYSEMDSIAVYARSANEDSIVIKARWVDSVEDLIEVPDYYAHQSDLKTLSEKVDDIGKDNSGYKKLFTKYGSDEETLKGYLAITMTTNNVVEIDIEEDYAADHSHYYLKLACGGDAHIPHQVLINSSNFKIYTDSDGRDSPCTWYIPWQLDYSNIGVSVSARFASSTDLSDTISGEWVSADDVNTEWWSEATERYTTQASAEKYTDEKTACKFDMVNYTRGRKRLSIGTWVCMHNSGEDKIRIMHANGNIRKDYLENEIPAFSFGIITISEPWKESYWTGLSSKADGYGRMHCSLLAKVGNEMKAYYWREPEGQIVSLIYDADETVADVVSCWKIG